jgi:hypothetical protein
MFIVHQPIIIIELLPFTKNAEQESTYQLICTKKLARMQCISNQEDSMEM